MKPLALLLGAALLFASAARAEDPAPVTPLSDTLRFLGLVMQDGSISPDEKEEIVEFNAATGPMSDAALRRAATALALREAAEPIDTALLEAELEALLKG